MIFRWSPRVQLKRPVNRTEKACTITIRCVYNATLVIKTRREPMLMRLFHSHSFSIVSRVKNPSSLYNSRRVLRIGWWSGQMSTWQNTYKNTCFQAKEHFWGLNLFSLYLSTHKKAYLWLKKITHSPFKYRPSLMTLKQNLVLWRPTGALPASLCLHILPKNVIFTNYSSKAGWNA